MASLDAVRKQRDTWSGRRSSRLTGLRRVSPSPQLCLNEAAWAMIVAHEGASDNFASRVTEFIYW
jgi:hypothetical protein